MRDAERVLNIHRERGSRRRSFFAEFTGEPDAVKIARPVWWGAVGKVPSRDGNSPAAYPTHHVWRGGAVFLAGVHDTARGGSLALSFDLCHAQCLAGSSARIR